MNTLSHAVLRVFTLGALCGFVAVAPAAAQADNVTTTKHNMSARSGLTNYNEVCVYCHTPHNGSGPANAPLWNRAFGTGPYSMYNNAFSSTIDMTVAATPQGVSLACLSCHDGTIGLDVIVNRPNADTSLAGTGTTMPGNAGQFFANLGTNLQNDHPVSITYDATLDPGFVAASAGRVGTLPLYTGRVECGTCHNPHNSTNSPFLRIANSSSTLCRTCHIK